MLKRYLLAATSGTVMTLGLLFVMHVLISIQPAAAVDHPTGGTLTWVPYQELLPPPPPPKPIDKRALTDVELPPVAGRPSGSGPTLNVYIPNTATGPLLSPIETPKNVDGPLVAMIRVQPNYPASANSRGLEGYALVEFDVLANGQTANVRAIESSNRIFEKPAIKAAERFKFKPRVVNGQAQVSRGIQNLFRFEMEAN